MTIRRLAHFQSKALLIGVFQEGVDQTLIRLLHERRPRAVCREWKRREALGKRNMFQTEYVPSARRLNGSPDCSTCWIGTPHTHQPEAYSPWVPSKCCFSVHHVSL